MDGRDIREFLSVIGSSGTGATRRELSGAGGAAFELIGQFGIGMLSAFVVAERVVVRTRKPGEPRGFAWHNSGSVDCELYADAKEDVGTEIVVWVAPDYAFLLGCEHVRACLLSGRHALAATHLAPLARARRAYGEALKVGAWVDERLDCSVRTVEVGRRLARLSRVARVSAAA